MVVFAEPVSRNVPNNVCSHCKTIIYMHIVTLTLILRLSAGSEAQCFTTDFPITLKLNAALLLNVWLMLTFRPGPKSGYEKYI